jgi:ribosome biogenesis GTPase
LLTSYGWTERRQHDFQTHAAIGLVPGRVIVQQRERYRLATEAGEIDAVAGGKLRHEAELPVAGDWVAASPPATGAAGGPAVIRTVLPRTSAFVRRAAGPGGGAQVAAANVETALLVASLNADLSLRRLERYLALAYESGADPVVVLSKADGCDDVAALTAEVSAIAFEAPVLAVSAVTGEGLAQLSAQLTPGRTAVLLGSSGVGKSTLVNALLGAERMATKALIEEGARGRHTTTHRELVRLPGGGLILDTPGMRELGLWDAEAGLSAAFDDVEQLATGCRFGDCRHAGEPGCAVQAALAGGRLAPERLASWRKLQKEAAYEARRDDPLAAQAERRRWAAIHKEARGWIKAKREIGD